MSHYSRLSLKDCIVIAQFGKSFGIKGWVKLRSFCEVAKDVYSYQPWFIEENSKLSQLQIEQQETDKLVVKVAGFDTPESVKYLTNKHVLVPKDKLPQAEDDTFYWHQLENLQVINQNGELFGKVSHLFSTGSKDILSVIACKGSIDQTNRLIPYLDDTVTTVDLANKTIFVCWDKDF